MDMKNGYKKTRAIAAAFGAAVALSLVQVQPLAAQPGQTPQAQRSARDAAPIDLTGQWVSVVTEDWWFRMVTPPKNDFPGLPLTAAARQVADAWDPMRDEAEGNACKSYGAGAIMRVPGRIRIAWQDASTLEIETDAGMQTRVLHFGGVPAQRGEPTWQGVSQAEWVPHGGGFGGQATAVRLIGQVPTINSPLTAGAKYPSTSSMYASIMTLPACAELSGGNASNATYTFPITGS
jgi:hypothetical protein